MSDTKDQPEKMPLTSMDVAGEKRDELKQCLGQEFPEVFMEGASRTFMQMDLEMNGDSYRLNQSQKRRETPKNLTTRPMVDPVGPQAPPTLLRFA